MQLIIPMAGDGSRFKEKGYNTPKPFLPLGGLTMIEQVISNIGSNCSKILLIARLEHQEYFSNFIQKYPNVLVIYTNKKTEGALCTVLLAKDYINNDEPLIIANSDQWIHFDFNTYKEWLTLVSQQKNVILTFPSEENKWSYALTDEEGNVLSVAEKQVISNQATVGVYSFSSGKNFIKYANELIIANDRFNNEFYLCPVYNYVLKKERVYTLKVGMYGLGTPEDYENNKEKVEELINDKSITI